MKITYASAGHPSALYYSKSTDKIEYLNKAQNPPLGIKTGLKYKYSSIDFTNDARILLYTDGVMESIGDKILEDDFKKGLIKQISAGIHPQDDFTLVEINL